MGLDSTRQWGTRRVGLRSCAKSPRRFAATPFYKGRYKLYPHSLFDTTPQALGTTRRVMD
jgi:hypothetical protein